MKIKHSKYKNTGILFELLVRQITADTLKGVDSPAINLLKENFVKSELGREYKLYESVLKSKVLSEGRANLLLSTILENSAKLNRTVLKKQKYNLINEIKKYYNLESFFGSKINNYKEIGSIYTLIESYNNKQITDIDQINKNKITLLEHLTKQITPKDNTDKLLNDILNNSHITEAGNEDLSKVSNYPLKEAREIFEKQYLISQLKKSHGNISKTADRIGMERSALHRKLKSLGIKDLN